jgi:hypothetical protein
MATFTKVRALPSALVLTFVLALSLAGAGAAHAAPRTTTKAAVPQTCFWQNDFAPSTQDVYWSDRTVVGFEEAEVQTYWCNGNPTDDHRAVFEMQIYENHKATCTPAESQLLLFADSTLVEGTIFTYKTIGDPAYGCVGGSNFTFTTLTYTSNNQLDYCAETDNVYYPASNPQFNLESGNLCP